MFGEVMLRQPKPNASTPATPSSSAKTREANAKERRSRMRDEEAKKAAFVYHFLSHDVEF